MATVRPLGRKTVEYIPMGYLNANPSNPSERSQEGGIRSLVKSIREDGLQYPILVSKRSETEYEIIDGHRRWAAYKGDHHDEMPCIVAEGSSSHLYTIVNGLSKPLTGKDWAYVYVNGGQVPKGVTGNNLVALSRLIGNDGIRDMAERGMAPGVYQSARKVAKYVYGEITDDKLAIIVDWLIKLRQTSNCMSSINNGRSAEAIKVAIESNKPVTMI